MRIRTATPDDVRPIAELHARSQRDAYRDLLPVGAAAGIGWEAGAQRWSARLGPDARGTVLVGESDDGELVGVGAVEHDDPPGWATVTALHVAPGHRRRGTGSDLLDAVLRTAAGAGCPRAQLHVLAGNEPARRFYERRGWRHRGRGPDHAVAGHPVETVRYEAATGLPMSDPPPVARDPWSELPAITTAAALDDLGRPTEAVRTKVLDRLGPVHAEWIRASPLVFVATSSAAGRCDVSPKGDPAGAVLVLDETTVAVPERAGNHRRDGFRNIVENPHAGLLFVVPGRPETMRLNGAARLVTDGPFFADLTVRGHRPAVALLVRVEEVFFHCPRAFQRAGAWRPERWQLDLARPYPEIAHALWRADQTLDAVRRHYDGEPPDAGLYPH